MSGVSLPVTRPVGRALIVGSPACRSQPLLVLQRLGFQCAEVDDPYSAMCELCRRPLVYHSLILSLHGLYREELAMIESIKRRFPHIEIWLSQTDGRQASLAEAMRLGADGLIADDGMHRTAIGAPAAPAPSLLHPPALPLPQVLDEEQPEGSSGNEEGAARTESARQGDFAEPVLTADELRALLQEQPSAPPGGGGGNRPERPGA